MAYIVTAVPEKSHLDVNNNLEHTQWSGFPSMPCRGHLRPESGEQAPAAFFAITTDNCSQFCVWQAGNIFLKDSDT